MTITVRPMAQDDAEAVLAIYQYGIDGGNATFETAVPAWEQFTATKIPAFSQVAVDGDGDGTILGWIAATQVSTRPCYAGVIEHSVYVHPDARGRGVGRRLLQCLIKIADAEGVWTIQSSLFPENRASIALHEALGFRIVGTRIKIARHHGRWRDTILIERRAEAT